MPLAVEFITDESNKPMQRNVLIKKIEARFVVVFVLEPFIELKTTVCTL